MSDFRYVHFYGEAVNTKKEALGIVNPDRISIDMYIDKTSVIAVRECIANDGESVDGSFIYLASGENFWVEDTADRALVKLGIISIKHERTAIE